MLGVLNNIKPEKVFEYFEAICGIPHGSYHCNAVSDFCVEFAEKRNLFVRQDLRGNIVIKKPAFPGYESEPPMILQGHLDMVCQQEDHLDFDFEKDPLPIQVEDDFIFAKGTTLGGDDGIAIAFCLAVLDDRTIAHPPLEVIFTTEEEVGMEGAMCLDMSILESRRMINLDSEEEGTLLAGCAGGTTVKAGIPLSTERKKGRQGKIRIFGLSGGHSGTEIDKGRANAMILAGELLKELLDHSSLISLEGGKDQKDNAISKEACITFLFRDEEIIKKIAEKFESIWNDRYHNSEHGIQVSLTAQNEVISSICLDEDSGLRISDYLEHTPNGVHTMSDDIDGLVESSLNLGMAEQQSRQMIFSYGIRSNIPKKKEEIIHSIKKLAEALGGGISRENDYPAWVYKAQSPLREKVLKAYREQYASEMKVEIIHAGLECGIFSAKVPDMDIVSIGPNIFDIHTVKERMSISSVQRTWKLLLKLLEEKE